MSSASTPTICTILLQLDATLQLIATLSLSLTLNKLKGIHQGLTHTYTSVEVILVERYLGAQRAAICKFHTNFLNPYSLAFNEDLTGDNMEPPTRGSASRNSGCRHHGMAQGTTSHHPPIHQSIGDGSTSCNTQDQQPVIVINISDEESSTGMFFLPVYRYLFLIRRIEA